MKYFLGCASFRLYKQEERNAAQFKRIALSFKAATQLLQLQRG